MADVQQAVQVAALHAAQPRAQPRWPRRTARQHARRRLQAVAAAAATAAGASPAVVLQGLLVQRQRLGPVARLFGRQALVFWAGAALAQAHQTLQAIWLLKLAVHLLRNRIC